MKCRGIAILLMGMLVGLVSGCVSTVQVVPLPDQTRTTANKDKARIYVLRRTGIMGAVYPTHVRDGDVEIGKLGAYRYLCWEREPSNATINIRHKAPPITYPDAKIKIECKAGQTYFLKHEFQSGGQNVLWNVLNVLSPDEAHELLKDISPPKVK